MTPPIDKPSSSFWSSSLNLVLLFIIPFFVFLVFVSTSVSPWTWGFGHLISHSFPSSNNSTDSSFMEAEADFLPSNVSFSDSFIGNETVHLVRNFFFLSNLLCFQYIYINFLFHFTFDKVFMVMVLNCGKKAGYVKE